MKRITILSGLLLLTGLAVQAQEKLAEYNVRPAVAVRTPIQGDSINFKGDKFAVANLLKTNIDLRFDGRSYERMAADTAGYVTVKKADKDNLFYLFATNLRAERFMKAKLSISSPARFEVFVNGESKQTKDTAEDSLSQVRPTVVSLRMEPEADYEIVIKLLSTADDKLAPALKCEFEKEKDFAAVGYQAAPDLKRRLALHNTAFGPRVSSVSLSPNGRYLLTTYSDNYSPKRSKTRCELTEVKTGRLILPNAPEDMRWMPTSNKLYYTVTGEQQKDLLVLDPATMKEEVLLKDIPEGYFAWSPTEDYLIYSSNDEGEKVEGPLKRVLHPNDRIPGSRNRYYLTKYDVTTGLSERLTYGSHNVYLNDISPDGKKLLCSTSKSNITECPFSLSALFEIDLATLQADTLVSWDGYLEGADYSPDGKQLLLTGGPAAFGGIGQNCGNHPIANNFDTQAFIMDLSTKKITPITRDFNPSVTPLQWNRVDGCIYFNTDDEDCRHIYRYTPKTASYEMLPLAEDVIADFDLAADNPSVAAYVGGGNTSVGVAYTYDAKKKTSTLLANPMKPTLDKIELGKMDEWNFTAADGTVIKGMICLPPDFDLNKKYPLIVYYYGGTTPTTRGITSPYCAQLFASRDYVVYVIQPSGAIGYGQEFSARHVNAWGDYTADNIIEGTKKFCAAHPFVNDKRIGCIGASYGGFMTMYLQTKTDMFAAAVSHAGISDVTSYWGEGYWGYSYNSVAAAESYPWNNPDLFTKHGALFNADKINTPLLLLQGTADTNVPIGESIQMYNALKILGKPVEYIQVDGENHFILDYPKRELWNNSIMAWFARWLQDSPEWWNDVYPERHW
ncbi:prolyl oligopeptidase family serine peptidase [Bacteroides sp.]|uniref:S9 family peptidase n=1 Tax=Bacteroides sp. TaxID=29523 RepID=UPI003AB3300C